MKASVPYMATVFFGAFLLFQVQPLIAKHLLPWFGGVPAVWTTCMLCFQVLLLAGYGYAHVLAMRMKVRRQVCVHAAALAASVALVLLLAASWGVPILPGPAWRPVDAGWPLGRLLGAVLAGVGVPFVVLATTGPLLQAWYGQANPGRTPYWLYALSNAGSLLGLLTYPLVIEPALTLDRQALCWAGGYVLYVLGCLVCGWQALCASVDIPDGAVPPVTAGVCAPASAARDGGAVTGDGVQPRGRILLWLVLPAVSCVMLLATTHLICQEIAVVPFLWILPLALYLASFIVCFAGERTYRSPVGYVVFTLAVVAACWLLRQGPHIPIGRRVVGFSAVLFACCMACHGELYRLRPAPRSLTLFYGMIATGGALGGVLVALVAPLVFDGPWEYYWGLMLATLAMLGGLAADRESRFRRFPMVRWALLAYIPILGLVLWQTVRDAQRNGVFASRSFYGTLRVEEKHAKDPALHAYRLYNGATLHGVQFEDKARRRDAVSYYGPTSGVGLAWCALRDLQGGGPLRMGVVGLGIGTLAAYGREGDVIRFYEINPDVVKVAQGAGGYFSYLKDSRAEMEVVLGDARLSIEREVGGGQAVPLDMLVIDAFSSDSIPVHLLTREAIELYLKRVSPSGVLAFHIANRYFDLWPVLASVGDSLGLRAVVVESVRDDAHGYTGSTWVLIPRQARWLDHPSIASVSSQRAADPKRVRVWTDRFSNLLQALR